MALTLLQTRLTVPPRRAGAVPRPRLVKQLNAGLGGRLTVVSAPAGFGKTTLVLEWLEQLPAAGFPWTADQVAWVSLDQGDNSPFQFFAYLLGALQKVSDGFGADLFASLENAPDVDFKVLVQDLLNESASLARSLLVVLDDYHLIKDDAIHGYINVLVEYLPPNVHLVLTTRDTPPLDLPRWRARGFLNEVSSAPLRFTGEEVRAFFSQTMQLDLPEETLNALKERTEGWAAGLQLAGLAIRSSASDGEVPSEITGRSRAVADYLLEEVLERQPADVQDFLLRTAILPQFTASLCDALMEVNTGPEELSAPGTRPAREMLSVLEKSDLFLVQLDHERRWYRYHHLFVELLRSRLIQSWEAEDVRALHLVASEWFAGNGMQSEAIEQAFEAGAQDAAAAMVVSISMQRLWTSEIGGRISTWTDRLSERVLQAHPGVVLQTAGAQLIRGEINGLRRSLEWLKARGVYEPEREILEAILVRNEGKTAEAFAMVQDAIGRLPDSSETIRDIAYLQLAVCSMELGDWEKGVQYTDRIRVKYETHPTVDGEVLPVHLQAIQLQGGFVEIEGDLERARGIYQSGIDLIEQSGHPNPMIGVFYARLGGIHYQWNEIDRAEALFNRAMTWGERTRISDILFGALFGQADLSCYYRNREQLEDVLEQINGIIGDARIRGMEARARGYTAGIWLRFGELEKAVRWANTIPLPPVVPPPYPLHEGYQIFAAVRIAESRSLDTTDVLPEMLDLVDQLIEQAEAVKNRGQLIRDHLLRALILDGLSRTQQAVTALYRALELGRAGGYTRIYLDAGPLLHSLLKKALASGKHVTHIRRLLVAFAQEPAETAARERQAGSRLPLPTVSGQPDLAAPLTEPLTERETEVLQLISSGLSNKEIQERLFISNNTVRTHIKNLYGKLGVSDRTQAVLRAQALGLV